MRLAHGASIKSAYTEDNRDVRMGAGLRGLHHAKSTRAGQSWLPGRSTSLPARKPIPSLVFDSVCLRAAMPRRLGSQPLRLCGLRAPQLRTPPSVLRAGNARSPRLLPIRSWQLRRTGWSPSGHRLPTWGTKTCMSGTLLGVEPEFMGLACWSCKTLNCMLRKFVVRLDLKLLVCPSGSAPRAFLQPGWLSDCLFLG